MWTHSTLSNTLSTGLFNFIIKKSFFSMSGMNFDKILLRIKSDNINNGNDNSESSSSDDTDG